MALDRGLRPPGPPRARRLDRDLIRGADLVLPLAREHLREVVVAVPDAFARTFTPKELVRRAAAAGGRRPDEALDAFLARLHEGRRHQELLRNDPVDDVLDPIGGPRSGYVRAATELESLALSLAELLDPRRRRARAGDHPRCQPLPGDLTMPWPSDDDRELFELIEDEEQRQNTTLQLIASENFTSPAVIRATGSVLTNKYSEGYPGKRYYGGNQVVDEIEDIARDRVKALFGAEHANVQPHSGANANLGVYLALLEPGDKVMGMSLDHGGHLTHGSPVNISGRYYDFVAYGVTPSDERIDYDEMREVALRERPKMIIAGATAYPRIIDPEAIRSIADEVGALFMFDAAHIAGLIAGGVHPSPVPFADIVTFTTHKTLRGPRGGCILATAELGPAIDKAIFPGLQGGPLEHVIAAKAVAFREAAQPEFRDYAAQIVAQRRRRWPRRWPARASASCPAAPTTTCCWSTCGPSTPSSPARRPRRCSTGPASR